MIYFDKEHNAYGDLASIKGKEIVYECENEIWEQAQEGVYIWENNVLVRNPDYEQEQIEKVRQEKYNENDTKAKAARYTQEFTLTIQGQECVFDTSNGTQEDLNTAALYCLATQQTYNDWVTNNGIHLNLTLEDISLIAKTFKEKSNVYIKWDEYRVKIKNAKSIAGLNRIKIEY